MQPPAAARVRVIWSIVAAASILVLSLVPSPGWPGARREFFTSLAVSNRHDWLDVVANVILYLPLGFTLAAHGVRRSRAFLIGITLSTTAELLQFVIPGRDPSLRDILTNTLGTALGAYGTGLSSGRRLVVAAVTVERGCLRLLDPTEKRANLTCIAYAVFLVALTSATVLLLLPWAPAARQYVIANATIDTLPGAVIIGAGNDEGTLKGLLDDVRIYATARSEDEIARDSDTSSPIPDPSLVAAFGFDDDAPGTATDASRHGNDAVLERVQIVPAGRHGKAAAFDGTGRMIIPSASSFGIHDAVTLEAWVYLDADIANAALITQESGAYELGLSSSSGPRRVMGGGVYGGSPTTTRSVESVPLRKWTHVATTYDSQVIRVFVNGRIDAARRRWSPHRPRQILLNGTSLPFGKVAANRRIAPALLDSFTLNVHATCGNLVSTAAPLFLATSARNIDPLALVAQRADVLVRNWTISRAIGLLAPDYRFDGALTVCSPGRPVELQLSGTLKRPQLTVDGRVVAGNGLGIGSAWALFIHSELLPEWLLRACAFCWLAALLVPFGYWLRRGTAGALACAVVVIALLVVPVLLGFALPTLEQGIAAAGGVLIGMLAWRSRRRRQL